MNYGYQEGVRRELNTISRHFRDIPRRSNRINETDRIPITDTYRHLIPIPVNSQPLRVIHHINQIYDIIIRPETIANRPSFSIISDESQRITIMKNGIDENIIQLNGVA